MRSGWQDPDAPTGGGSDGNTSRGVYAAAATLIIVVAAVLGALAWRTTVPLAEQTTASPTGQVSVYTTVVNGTTITTRTTSAPQPLALRIASLPSVAFGQNKSSGQCQWAVQGLAVSCQLQTQDGTGLTVAVAIGNPTGHQANVTVTYSSGWATRCSLQVGSHQAPAPSGRPVALAAGSSLLLCQADPSGRNATAAWSMALSA